MHRAAVWVVRLAILPLFLRSSGSGWYLAKRGFGRQWRSLVVEELHKRGVEASVGRLTLDPFRGLVAKNVRIFDYKNRENTLALISEISLDINYAALIHHESFLNALDVRNAQITLPLDDARRNEPRRCNSIISARMSIFRRNKFTSARPREFFAEFGFRRVDS